MDQTASPLPRLAATAVVFAACLFGAGCQHPWQDLFHVESAGARLPVVVYGPRDASTLVLFQHGGPDGRAGIDPLPPGLARLSDKALVVAWAQRSTSLAAGISSTRDNTIAQHVADLHAVRQAVAMRYPKATRVVLAGHSWGVALTLAYLDQHGETGLTGLLLTDGFDAYSENAERSLVKLAELAGARAAGSAGDEAASWGEVVRFARGAAEGGAPFPLKTILEASDACARLEEDLERPEPADAVHPALGAVFSPLLVPDGLIVGWNFRTMISELMGFDHSEGLGARRLPALFIWGENDCRVPVSTGESMRARYGGAATLVVIQAATHFALYSQPRAFAEPALAFLESLP